MDILRNFPEMQTAEVGALSPFFEHAFARLGYFDRDRWNLWARRHNDQWLYIEPQPKPLRECCESMRENPWFHF